VPKPFLYVGPWDDRPSWPLLFTEPPQDVHAVAHEGRFSYEDRHATPEQALDVTTIVIRGTRRLPQRHPEDVQRRRPEKARQSGKCVIMWPVSVKLIRLVPNSRNSSVTYEDNAEG
jgi:hypothetical protein